MIVYSATRQQFLEDVISNRIDDIVHQSFQRRLGHRTSPAEIRSWNHSLTQMNNVLTLAGTVEDAGVAIEFQVPFTAKRVDFILTGRNAERTEKCVIVELKQWGEVQFTEKNSMVETFIGGGLRETPHPSYQAWSYAEFIKDYNVEVRESNIELQPCCYLHNCENSIVLKSNFYKNDLEKAPAFAKFDTRKLAQFLNEHVHFGDDSQLIQRIDNSPLKPSKQLANYLVSLKKGNQEFTLLDEQKVVFETGLLLAKKSQDVDRQVLLVEGGPGTGKSIVAINMMIKLTEQGYSCRYVTRNSAPREVYYKKLKGTDTQKNIKYMFSAAGDYHSAKALSMDALIVDEAHRLSEKSGYQDNLGENQVMEIIRSSRLSVFFLDESQKVAMRDIGTRDEILKWAKQFDAGVVEQKLESQFRCNGSDGYLAWIDNSLDIKETANPTLEGIDYDFDVFDNPQEMREEIVRLNEQNNTARLVAGYCWDWISKKDLNAMDITFPEYRFQMQWNLISHGQSWLVEPNSINEVGCIHTCQGLEMDYVGVIVGEDLVVRNGFVTTDAEKRATHDRRGTMRGYRTLQKKDPELAKSKADAIIKNTYRTLMTRGQKGCFVFCVDKETNEYFKKFVNSDKRAKSRRELRPAVQTELFQDQLFK